ncbi:MAG: HAD family hydrolase [Gloeocapsa sp. DLM2.Bin57]|nr:MAG: HAD family hydrolase [Gloeocapsa sp. DLM2.Bin57]
MLILALDFDGVLCDGIAEYFYSSRLAYQKIWDSLEINSQLEPAFRRLRPVIETGWEMPLLLRALTLGISEASLVENWSAVSKAIVTQENLDKGAIATALDQVRDRLIASDLDSWLALQRFYPGVIHKVKSLLQERDIEVYIVSTKEGRFIKALLEQVGVQLPPESIIGKEIKQPKYQTLTQLLAKHNCQPSQLWFVEDRLKALELVEQQPNLEGVGLFLATWGYNTPAMRSSIANHPRIKLLSLEEFQNLTTTNPIN